MGKKIGRNDPCPCGNGKKYKQCCLSNVVTTPPLLEEGFWEMTPKSIARGFARQEAERKKNYYPKPEFPIFDTPPKLIQSWEELKEFAMTDPSPLYKLDVEEYTGSIRSKDGKDTIWIDENCITDYVYLSTHTFYGKTHAWSTEILRRCGFNVTIDNWDKEEDINGK